MTILLLRLLLRFCFDWEDISNTRDSVSSAIQTPRISSKILRSASYFQLSSRCLDIPMKHCLSCLIYYMKNYMPWISSCIRRTRKQTAVTNITKKVNCINVSYVTTYIFWSDGDNINKNNINLKINRGTGDNLKKIITKLVYTYKETASHCQGFR